MAGLSGETVERAAAIATSARATGPRPADSDTDCAGPGGHDCADQLAFASHHGAARCLCCDVRVGDATLRISAEPTPACPPVLERMLRHAADAAAAAAAALRRVEQARRESLTDPLTGLYNRRCFDEMADREILLARRHGHPLTLAAIDLDRFKQINDTLGHAAGDAVLIALADCIRTTLRRSDIPFRLGGDEFVVLLRETPLDTAAVVADKLHRAFGATPLDLHTVLADPRHVPDPHRTPAHPAAAQHTPAHLRATPAAMGSAASIRPTLSIGLAALSDATPTASALLAQADAALYAAKSAGRQPAG